MVSAYQDLVVHLIISMAPTVDEAFGTNSFPHLILGLVITGIEYELPIRFQKIKPPIFLGTKFEEAFEFIIDHYTSLHRVECYLCIYLICGGSKSSLLCT